MHREGKFFDIIFMVVLVVAYTFLSFFNLGDDFAPQTFYRLRSKKELAIILPKETEVSKIAYYIGISRNDFTLSYRALAEGGSWSCQNYQDCQNQFFSTVGLEFSREYAIGVDGPFRWRETPMHKTTSMIILKNTSDRDIDFGEISVVSGEERVSGITYREVYMGESLIDNGETVALSDEQDLIPAHYDYHNSSYFDELYFAQTAYQYATDQEGYETVHPPLGKFLQSLPIRFFGRMTPFTWRFAGNVAGILIIIVVYFLAKELFGSASFGRLAAVLVALSGLHFVQTRVGTIDSHLYLFTLLTYLFMLKFLKTSKFSFFALSGVFFGCCFAVKWSGAFAGIGLAIMFFWWVYKNYLKGDFKKTWKIKLKKLKFWRWILAGTLCFVAVPAVIYFGSYLLFPKTTNAYSISDVVDQGTYLFEYHSGERTPHPFSSPWFTWPISLKPMLYEYVSGSERVIYLYENYAIAFVSVVALIITAYFAIRKRSKTALFILIAFLSLWLPYAFIQRPMFLYHYLPASGFAILAIVEMFYEMPKIRKIIPFLLVIIVLVFIVSYPRFSGI